MIYKSYLVEKNINSINENLVLFYGENIGIKNDFKGKIKKTNNNCEFIFFDQKNILQNFKAFYNELFNASLFEKDKVFFIENVDDKSLEIINDIQSSLKKQRIFLFSETLEKKSKLRSFFEQSRKCAIIPCYPDNEITIKNIILEKLRGYEGLDGFNINLILNHVSLDRVKLNNEIDKISIYFTDKKINSEKLSILLDANFNSDFNILKDEAINGNKKKTNELLSYTILDDEKIVYYLTIINQRLQKLYQIKKNNELNIETAISKLKPPIFWKDKPQFISQAKKWDLKDLKKFLKKIYDLEKIFKSNSFIHKKTLLKELVTDICKSASV